MKVFQYSKQDLQAKKARQASAEVDHEHKDEIKMNSNDPATEPNTADITVPFQSPSEKTSMSVVPAKKQVTDSEDTKLDNKKVQSVINLFFLIGITFTAASVLHLLAKLALFSLDISTTGPLWLSIPISTFHLFIIASIHKKYKKQGGTDIVKHGSTLTHRTGAILTLLLLCYCYLVVLNTLTSGVVFMFSTLQQSAPSI